MHGEMAITGGQKWTGNGWKILYLYEIECQVEMTDKHFMDTSCYEKKICLGLKGSSEEMESLTNTWDNMLFKYRQVG